MEIDKDDSKISIKKSQRGKKKMQKIKWAEKTSHKSMTSAMKLKKLARNRSFFFFGFSWS